MWAAKYYFMGRAFLAALAVLAGFFFVAAGCMTSGRLSCVKPSVLVGGECCLDGNVDGVCDRTPSCKEVNAVEYVKKDSMSAEPFWVNDTFEGRYRVDGNSTVTPLDTGLWQYAVELTNVDSKPIAVELCGILEYSNSNGSEVGRARACESKEVGVGKREVFLVNIPMNGTMLVRGFSFEVNSTTTKRMWEYRKVQRVRYEPMTVKKLECD